MEARAWKMVSAPTRPGDGQLLVLRARVDELIDAAGAAAAQLLESERQAVARHVRDDDRVRALIGRLLVRRTLTVVLGDPARVRIEVGRHGKPTLDRTVSGGWEFNVSHSGAWVLAVFARNRAVGVDVERCTDLPLDELAGMAAIAFSADERSIWQRLPASQRAAAFFRLWAHKEAYLKGTGDGVAEGVAHATLAIAPAAPQVMADARRPLAAQAWQLRDLHVAAGYESAVAWTVSHPAEPVTIETRHVAPAFLAS